MKKKRNNGGFTLAELLIVVAVVVVLAGVSFIVVQNHQKSLAQLKRDSIAEEIFFAAQNHLTLAKSQNYNGSTAYGTPGTLDEEDKTGAVQYVYYFTDDGFTTDGTSLLDQMLPFGSLDETIRTGGCYLIRYQPDAGRVLDVFYWEKSEQFLEGSNAVNNGSDTSYDNLMRAEKPLKGADANARRNRSNNKPMVGWFGDEEVADTGVFLNAPMVEVINAEKLIVKVTGNNPETTDTDNPTTKFKLIIKGQTSKAMASIELASGNNNPRLSVKDDVYTIVLDDITTKDLHFANFTSTPGEEGVQFWTPDVMTLPNEFIPGENITVQAVAYQEQTLASVAYSGEWTTNSLFGDIRINDDSKTALISNIRHLENLDAEISSFAYTNEALFNYNYNNIVSAEQTVDLSWQDFTVKIAASASSALGGDGDSGSGTGEGSGSGSVQVFDKNGKSTLAGCYMPVTPGYALSYDGQSTVTKPGETTTTEEKVLHSVTGIKVDNAGATDANASIAAGGMFGTLVAGSSISNLALVDFSVSLASTTDPGNAGALAGTITDTTVTNVVAYNSSGITGETDNRKISASGAAGGLIGSMAASSDAYKVEKSAAALIVESTDGNAGGLIGTASRGTVSACYSAGHTIDKKDSEENVIGILYDKTNFNVTAAGYAGGLIGTMNSTAIDHSYSTCSATGNTAGGFIGVAQGNGSIEDCYATGLVCGTDKENVTIDDVNISDVPKDGAFAYSLADEVTVTNCKYFEIINERADDTMGFDYLTALGKKGSNAQITAIDATAATYNSFVGAPGGWENATVYDATLTTYYGTGSDDDRTSRYNLQTVKQLGATLKQNAQDTTKYYVATHYGDWPAPEIFVENKGN